MPSRGRSSRGAWDWAGRRLLLKRALHLRRVPLLRPQSGGEDGRPHKAAVAGTGLVRCSPYPISTNPNPIVRTAMNERQHAPAADRNKEPILAVLRRVLPE